MFFVRLIPKMVIANKNTVHFHLDLTQRNSILMLGDLSLQVVVAPAFH